MAYRIVYGEDPANQNKQRFWSGRLHFMTALCFVLFIFSVKLLWGDALDTILPEGCGAAISAMENMVSEIRTGAGFADAVTAFCREIIAEAGIG